MILAIDPGASGGWALMGGQIGIDSMGKLPKMVDGLYDFNQDDPFFYWLRSERVKDLVIEAPFRFNPNGQGISTMATVHSAWGQLVGAAGIMGMSVYPVSASAWKKKLGLNKKDKMASVDLACALYPTEEEWLRKYKNREGVAEAILVGHYYLTRGQ